MKKNCIALFTGQGAQYVNMLDEFVEKDMDTLKRASDVLGYDILEMSRDKDKIFKTEYSQPLNFVYEYLKFKEFSKYNATIMIGHSMGEFVALTCAGVLDFAAGLKLIMMRAKCMSKVKAGYRMFSVMGITNKEVEKLCNCNYSNIQRESDSYNDNRIQIRSNSSTEILVSNYNGKKQTIVTVQKDQIDSFKELFKKEYPKVLIKDLKLDYPFHTIHMKNCADEFKKIIDKTEFVKSDIKIILNATGRMFDLNRPTLLKKYLVEQMYRPVRFTDCLKEGFLSGEKIWIEFGPKPVLSKMAMREYKDVKAFSVSQIGAKTNIKDVTFTPKIQEKDIIAKLKEYLYILSTTETKNVDELECKEISKKYRLLSKMYSSYAKQDTNEKNEDEDYQYQYNYAKKIFEEAMLLK